MLHTLFEGGKKTGKNLKQNIVLLYYFILLSKASMIQLTKAASLLGLGKSIFFRAALTMYMQLHTQANHEI